MKPDPSVLEKLQTAYDLVAEVLGQAPQLYDLHLDQALLVLVLAMKQPGVPQNYTLPSVRTIANNNCPSNLSDVP